MKRALVVLLSLLLLAVIGVGVAIAGLSEPLPQGVAGEEAEAMAREMLRAVDAEAWEELGAVRWTFAGQNTHLWDKRRHLARVRWKQTEVLVDLSTQRGRAWRRGEELVGRRAEEAVEKAYAAWINDSFWLNPVVKAFDEGTTRFKVAEDKLLVQYDAGGLTPGDAYLWELGPDKRPVAWGLWVSILPIKGARVSWAGWTQLPGGAWVSTEHAFERLGLTILITELEGAATLSALEPGADPFEALSPSE